MWEVTLGVGTLLLIILAAGFFGAIGAILLIATAFNR
jgi:hypothetical protein